MSIESQVLARAASRIGYRAPADPQPGSEAGRYLARRMGQPWLAGPSTRIWWCMCFVSMCLDEVGQADAIGGLSYNTDVTIRNARRVGCEFVSVAQARPGDVVIFNWNGGPTDHVGLVERNLGGGVLQTIEGNTSPGTRGSQSAGNGVWRRRRSSCIAAVIRPRYHATGGRPAAPAPAAPAASSGGLAVDGWFGPATIRAAQSRLGTPVDGVVSGQPPANRRHWPRAGAGWQWRTGRGGSAMVRALQGRLGVTVDGWAGPETIRRWQLHLGITPDGYAGPATVSAIQLALNDGRLW